MASRSTELSRVSNSARRHESSRSSGGRLSLNSRLTEMSDNRRLEMLSDIAGDCLVKMLKAVLNIGGTNQGMGTPEEDWVSSWNDLQGER